jgi:hypothetical protein
MMGAYLNPQAARYLSFTHKPFVLDECHRLIYPIRRLHFIAANSDNAQPRVPITSATARATDAEPLRERLHVPVAGD